MIERRTLKEIVLDRQSLDITSERLPRMADLALRLGIFDFGHHYRDWTRRRQHRSDTGALKLLHQRPAHVIHLSSAVEADGVFHAKPSPTPPRRNLASAGPRRA